MIITDSRNLLGLTWLNPGKWLRSCASEIWAGTFHSQICANALVMGTQMQSISNLRRNCQLAFSKVISNTKHAEKQVKHIRVAKSHLPQTFQKPLT